MNAYLYYKLSANIVSQKGKKKVKVTVFWPKAANLCLKMQKRKQRQHLRPKHSPGLLCHFLRPLVATLVPCGVVRALKRLQVTDDWIGNHDDEGQRPCSSNHPIGMGTGLPHP